MGDIANLQRTNLSIFTRVLIQANIGVDMETKEERLMKGNDVAKFLNISRSLAYRMMQSGEIPTIRFGGSVRVQLSDLEKFIMNHKSTLDELKPLDC